MSAVTVGGFEAWRLVLVGRLILNSIAIALNLLSCLLLGKLYKRRRHHTSILILLYLSYSELTFALSSQVFSVLFLASHASEEAHNQSSPIEHNKLTVLIALASSGSLKHSSLFVRQWWVLSLCSLHAVANAFGDVSVRLAGRQFVKNLFAGFCLLGGSFGFVRLIAEKVPEYFRKKYVSDNAHEVIHSVLHILEFGVPPLLLLPSCSALALLLCCRRRHAYRTSVKTDEQPQEQPTEQQEQQQQQQQQLVWSRRSSQVTLVIGLLFLVCQGPLVMLDRVGAESRLFINLQDLLASLFSCSLFVVLGCSSSAFRKKLIVMCTCTVTPSIVAQDTVLDSCYEMVANDATTNL